MSSEMSAPATRSGPPAPYGPPVRRRLTRSSRERLWAGVAGGVAEYFEIDPSLVRLLFVLAAIVTGGAAIPVYFAAWLILPPDDRRTLDSPPSWRDWSEDFHTETQRLAEEARRRAGGRPTRTADAPPTINDMPIGTGPIDTTQPTGEPEPWWQSERYTDQWADQPRHGHSNARTAGILLVAVGVLFLAANAGLFSWVQWRNIWPLFLIGLGLFLFLRRAGWR
jgi:phage shock protein C